MRARILEDGTVRVATDLATIRAAIAAERPTWIDLEEKTADADELLSGVLGLHALTIEDIWAERSSPKIDDFPDYLYVLVHGLDRDPRVADLRLVELDVVIGKSWVVTHDGTGCISSDVAKELDRSPRLLSRGPAWVTHALLDRLVDRYLPVIDDLDEQIEGLENEVLAKAGTPEGGPVLARLLGFKRSLQALRRMGIHQREILLRLGRGEFDEIPPDAIPFYRDVYDHFVRIGDLSESYRDLVTGALDAYLSVQSNRMNEIMKTLTLISTVMLPLTFVAGVYGMNFKLMPELEWTWGYPYALGLMATIAVGILLWFRRKRWL